MFEPDVLLPEQFRALQGKVLSAEQRLLFAILEDAIHCFQTYACAIRPRERRIFREVMPDEHAEIPHHLVDLIASVDLGEIAAASLVADVPHPTLREEAKARALDGLLADIRAEDLNGL